MRALRTHGFALTSLLLILVVAGAIIGTGWYVLKTNNATTHTLADAGKAEKGLHTKSSSSCELSSGKKGTALVIGQRAFTICAPNGWTLYKSVGTDSLYYAGADNIAYDGATASKVVQVEGGKDGPLPLSIWATTSDVFGPDQTKGFTLFSDVKGDRTIGNLVLDRYYHPTGKNDSVGAGVSYLPENTKQYLDVIHKKNDVLVIAYNVEPHDIDQISLINQVAASAK